MADQVTDKIEKTLQEVPHADIIRSLHQAGRVGDDLPDQDDSPPKEVQRDLVPDAQEDRRHAWHAARRRDRALLQRRVRRCHGSIFALSADGFSREELREFADRTSAELLQVRMSPRSRSSARSRRRSSSSFPASVWPARPGPEHVIAQIGAQNAVENAGVLDAGSQNLQVRVGGQFGSLGRCAPTAAGWSTRAPAWPA